MAFVLLYHQAVLTEDIPSINPGLRNRIAKAIEQRLTTKPESYGVPLRRSLKGYWKLRVGDYRVVFKPVGNRIWILAIGDRRDVYPAVAKRLEGA